MSHNTHSYVFISIIHLKIRIGVLVTSERVGHVAPVALRSACHWMLHTGPLSVPHQHTPCVSLIHNKHVEYFLPPKYSQSWLCLHLCLLSSSSFLLFAGTSLLFSACYLSIIEIVWNHACAQDTSTNVALQVKRTVSKNLCRTSLKQNSSSSNR